MITQSHKNILYDQYMSFKPCLKHQKYLQHGASINKVPIGIFLAEKLEGSLQCEGLKSHNVAPFGSANKTYILRKLYDRRGRLLKSKVPREDVPNARKKHPRLQ